MANSKNDLEVEAASAPEIPAVIGIRYDGLADTRSISSAELVKVAVVGVSHETDLVWDKSNRKTISSEGLSPQLVAWLIEQPGFSAV